MSRAAHVLATAVVALTALGPSAAHAADAPPFRIPRYAVELRVDLDAQAIAGDETIALSLPAGAPPPRLPLHALTVDALWLDGRPAPVEAAEGALLLPAPPGRTTTVRVSFHGPSPQGLVFGPRAVHTTFFACAWMICDEDPSDRSTLDLALLLPPGLASVASGEPVSRTPGPGGLVRHAWREPHAYPSYLFAFAAGPLTVVRLPSRGATLEVAGQDSAERLRTLFAPTDEMRRFFEEKAGLPLPHAYRQVMVEDDEAQEATSLALLGREALESRLADSQEDWAIAHELAHQWWGNLLTCRSWADFWLNEGVTSFMTAAWKERRWGREAYDRELALFRKRHQVAIDAGFDVPLAFAGEYPSLRVKRAITYAKGALFMDLLRRELGERAFWEGLRRYTRRFAGRSVTSADLQRCLEESSGRSLRALFEEWVYPGNVPRDGSVKTEPR